MTAFSAVVIWRVAMPPPSMIFDATLSDVFLGFLEEGGDLDDSMDLDGVQPSEWMAVPPEFAS